MVHEVLSRDEATIHREPSREGRRVWAMGHRCGNPSSAEARNIARLRVTPVVVAPGFASFPVICGESAEDSLVARGEYDTSDKNPDSNATILYTQHVRI